MNDLEKQGDDNIGGFNSIQIIDLENIVSIPDHVDYIISDDIHLLADWFNIEFTRETLKLADGEIFNDKGTGNKPLISFFHPKDNAISLNQLRTYVEKNIVVKLKNNNGDTKIVGSITTPLRVKYKSTPGNNYSGRTGYNVSIYGLSITPALFFTGNTIIDP